MRAGRSALVATVVAIGLTGCAEITGPDDAERIAAVERTVERPWADLDSAIEEARASRRSSLVQLRAVAERAGRRFDDGRDQLGSLTDLDDEATSRARSLRDALDDFDALTEVLGAATLSPGRIEQAASRADLARRDLSAVSLDPLATEPLVAGLRKARRAARRTPSGASAATGRPSAPVGSGSGGRTGRVFTYTSYDGGRFAAQLPTGQGWGTPTESSPGEGLLFRTSVRGPDGLFVIIDYTPAEAATFGGSYQTRETVGQTAFGSATRYVFQGGSIPECQGNRCVDYIINSGSEGFAVLAGGDDFATVSSLAQAVAESVVPVGD